MSKKQVDLSFSNIVIDKKKLKHLIVWAFRNYGIARAANMSDKLKDLGFYYATKAGLSLSLEDLRIPPIKKELLQQTISYIVQADSKYKKGKITAVERFQIVIDTWNNASEMLKKEIIKYFKKTDPLNAIYMMAFSGARGNISQVRQLVGMRGLMSDPQGQIIDLPIASNFREGLTVTDYFISSYGARKGLVDIALRTADSGYLTRRLVDVAQDVIIREIDCKTSRGILLESISDNQKTLVSLEDQLIGRLLAEDLFKPNTNQLIAPANQDISADLAQKIIQSGISKVLVRSPITCGANSSVCQKCYGWNLAHGRLVDLGEAVGIIAAQSIGEPGTQLTMRTFHTGGVFTGELVQKVYASFDGVIEYSDQCNLEVTRTRHGDKAYLVKHDCFITLTNITLNKKEDIFLGQGYLCLVDNKSLVSFNQPVAEYPLVNRFSTEKAQKLIVSNISGKIYCKDLIVEEIENKQNIIKHAHRGGLVWVLSGQVYNISNKSQVIVKQGESIQAGSIIAIRKIVCDHSGYIRIVPKAQSQVHQEVLVIISLQVLLNVQIIVDKYSSSERSIIEINNKDKFILQVVPYQKLIDGQVIGELISDVYKTQTGGIIKYLDLPVSKVKDDFGNEHFHILSSGYVLWIAEETHEINRDKSLCLVKHGDCISAGTEIMKNVFAQNSGIVEIAQKDDIVKEVVIKPCKIYSIDDDNRQYFSLKKRGFLRPGDKIIHDFYTNKLVYWEYLDAKPCSLLLIRPVIVYSIPNKQYIFEYTKASFNTDIVQLSLMRKINFKDGARVKSIHGVDLIKTSLIIKYAQNLSHLSCFIEFNNSLSSLQLIVADNMIVRDDLLMEQSLEVISTTKFLIKNHQFISRGQVVAQTELLSTVRGQVVDIQHLPNNSKRLLILTDNDIRSFDINPNLRKEVKIKLNDWVYKDQELVKGVKLSESGQIISIEKSKIVLRVGRPYLISDGSILHINHHDLIKRGDQIATLIFDRMKTGDIVQGLPRIEEILEARKRLDSVFNPHILLEQKFNFYLDAGLSLYDATKMSIQDIQLILIKEVQAVYQSQGVDIADKHIEVIVRQMTSKVKIEKGGDTNYLPGEIVSLKKVEETNKLLSLVNKVTAIYYPILLGITKASLNTESFISAASFQETTKVLTEAAISGRLDWLRGLKENVIIGRLIPAGTGFNLYNHNISINQENPEINMTSLQNKVQSGKSKGVNNFDDIILDDRIARNFSDFSKPS